MSQQPIIGVIGVGYVGLVSAACFAELGYTVVCRDIVPEKVEQLRAGQVPFYEPGLADLLVRNRQRLTFTIDLREVTDRADVIFVCVNTPPLYSGDADLSFVEAVIDELPDDTRDVVLVMKSTVPVGTGRRLRGLLDRRGLSHVKYVSNPEFLKEGDAIADFMHPDRVVVGGDDDEAIEAVAALHRPLEAQVVRTDVATAEMVKYASNAFLATKISFINEIANVCEETGADVTVVAEGMGLDRRIGTAFLRAGIGFGGSCLPGDETVLVRRDGIAARVTLANLFHNEAAAAGAPRDAMVVEPDGLEVESWSADLGTRFLPVSAATRRNYDGELLVVTTKMGRRIRCTPDHPFVVRDGDGIVRTKLASELTTSDWLPLAGPHERQDEAPPALQLAESVLAAGDIAPDELIVRPGNQLAGVPRDDLAAAIGATGPPRSRTRAHEVARSGAMRLPELRELELADPEFSFGTCSNGTYLPSSIECDVDFWRIVGLYLAEGHICRDGRRERIQWSFHPDNEQELVEEVAGYWRARGVKADTRRTATTSTVTVSSRALAAVFRDVLLLGENCYEHGIPDQAWGAPDDHKWALLGGLWHGDGSWSLVDGGPSVVLEYGTVSHALADGIARLLGQLGIVARIKVGTTGKSTRDTYWLTVSGAAQVERAIELVKPADRVGVLSSIARQAKRIAPTGYRQVGAATWVRVSSIDRAPHRQPVYSLEVPGTHTFVASAGLVTHNCFPKDVSALKQLAGNSGYHFQLLNAVIEVNELQKRRLVSKLVRHLGPLQGKVITLLGLAFKPNTDDMREAASLVVSSRLAAEGAIVRGHDPIANEVAREMLPSVEIFDDVMEAVRGADAVVLVTEWPQYAELHLPDVAQAMKTPVLIDGRNLFSPQQALDAGFTYEGIGREARYAGTPARRATDRSAGVER